MKELFVKIKKIICGNKDVLVFTIIGLLLIILLPLLLKFPLGDWVGYFDYSETGAIGDTIGGITSPFINLLGAILVYIAFKEQVKANENQEKINIRQEEINKENEAEKVSNNIEDQISKLELYILEDKFKLSIIGKTYKNMNNLIFINEAKEVKLKDDLDSSKSSKVLLLQLILLSIINKLHSSKKSNQNYEWQKIKVNYLYLHIMTVGYTQIETTLELLEEKLLIDSESIEKTIIRNHKRIEQIIEKL